LQLELLTCTILSKMRWYSGWAVHLE